jgi:hypothetical protein
LSKEHLQIGKQNQKPQETTKHLILEAKQVKNPSAMLIKKNGWCKKN